jgi:orotidine-5'-phosphate decarboxylase
MLDIGVRIKYYQLRLMNFTEKLYKAMQENKSMVCIGLDPDPELMPHLGAFEFNKSIINATADLVCAYKPNLAFYEALGIEGLAALHQTMEYIPANIPVIGDAKRGDIGNTARLYAKALFEAFGFDAATVSPYVGFDSVEPFIKYIDRGVFILCRTSNPSASDFQSLPCMARDSHLEQGLLFEIVAQKAKEWNQHGNVGLVVGATYPEELARIRELCPQMLLLIPGIGTQGGDLAQAVRYGADAKGGKAVFCCSRKILYASKGNDFAQAARCATEELRNQINSLLKPGLTPSHQGKDLKV